MAETECGGGPPEAAVLVHSGSQADGIWKLQPEGFHGMVRADHVEGFHQAAQRAHPAEVVQSGDAQVMGFFRIHPEEKGPDEVLVVISHNGWMWRVNG